MSNPFRKLSAGASVTEFSVTAYNAFIDTYLWMRQQRATLSGGGSPGVDYDQSCFVIRNDSGEDRSAYEILGVSDIRFNPSDNLNEFKNYSSLVGVAPDEDEHTRNIAILLDPVSDGKPARACLVGVVPVLIEMQSDIDGYATIETDNCHNLVSSGVGYPIVWVNDTDADDEDENIRWGLVRIGNPVTVRRFKGTTTAAVGEDESPFTVNTLYATDGGPEWDDDDETEYEVVNPGGFEFDSDSVVYVETDSTIETPDDQPSGLRVYDGPCPA